MSGLAGLKLPKDQKLWMIGGAIALGFVVLRGKTSIGPSNAASISPADLLDAIRTTSGAAAGTASAGISAGGSVAVAGLDAGSRIASDALNLAGRTVDAQGRVTETAVGSLSRSIDSTLALLGKFADSRSFTFTPAPAPIAPPAQPILPAPRPVQTTGQPGNTPPPFAVAYDTPAPSDFARKVGADAQGAGLGSLLRAPLTYQLVTGERVTLG